MPFDIPVVLIFFKRVEKTVEILDRIAEVRPRKLYLIADAGRTPAEAEQVRRCRAAVEARIDWPCEVIRNYADENAGVYDRIGLGAQWVFSREPCAVFLEDDNLPERTFFEYCKTLLDRYRDDDRVLWVCGTNYLSDYEASDGCSYVFTRYTLPCGWASWAHKFSRYYDGALSLWDKKNFLKRARGLYSTRGLLRQQKRFIGDEFRRSRSGKRFASWDHQMTFSLLYHGLLGISPAKNQICNIGVDEDTTHGGASLLNPMTRRFCRVPTAPLTFPLVHPTEVTPDAVYEKLVGRILRLPWWYSAGLCGARLVRVLLRIPEDVSLSQKVFALLQKLKKG